MKKTILSIALTTALSAAAGSTTIISTNALADTMNASANNNNIPEAEETYLLPGMGIGAAAGTAVAGPVGFIVGGIVGAFMGSSQAISEPEKIATSINKNTANTTLTPQIESLKKQTTLPETELNTNAGIQLAHTGSIHTVIPDAASTHLTKLLNNFTRNLTEDIYFRSGSSAIEAFYPERLAAIARLMKSFKSIDVHLEGFTDRRGNKAQNIALAKARIEKVREQLIQAGIKNNRIFSHAYGDTRTSTTAGDLDAYNFDRRVVIRFENTNITANPSIATAPQTTVNNEPETVSVNKTNTDTQLADTGPNAKPSIEF